jgi:hypothetical protein
VATSGSWRIYGSVTGLPSGTKSVDLTVTAGASAPDETDQLTINGFQALTVPTGATAVLIIPPSANANAITLKGVTGDTGVLISKTQPTLVTLGTSPSIGLLTAASTVINLVWL